MKFYNTLTKKVEEFKSVKDGFVGFYTCGPTVYHYAHIGNMRNYIGHDILEKVLEYIGYDVKRVMNITDVGHLSSDADTGDDKMVKSAIRENKSVMDIAKFYTDAFFVDFKKLNCDMPDVIEPATNLIYEYINIINVLLEKGYAYQSNGNVYFDISKLDNYYKLTNQSIDDLVLAVRDDVEVDESKRNPGDFVLWFTKSKFQDQELKWDSPFGIGYPGWHMECTGIGIKHLGEYIDIHGGGVDNIFPHHTNEIAQSEAYLGHVWCKYWFHNEHLNDESGKMSKSKGGILTVSVLQEKGYNPLSFRYMCLNSHYRKQMVFSFDNLNVAENAYKKLLNKIDNINEEGSLEQDKFEHYNNRFIDYISDDLNTSNAITLLYELIKDNDVNGKTKIELIKSFDKVFSLNLVKENVISNKHDYILKKIEERKIAKSNKDFELADKIRNDLLNEGIILVDTREGTTYKMEE